MNSKNLLLALPLILFSMVVKAQTTYYVKSSVTTSGAGTSWASAYKTLQEALTTATSGDQIWVAAGTYYPDEGGTFADNDRAASFSMKEGVKIYGGFEGNETLFSDRNWKTNLTILSGDIDQNDGVDFSNTTNNTFRIIVNNNNGLTAAAVLDGFTISDGNANDLKDNFKGGGMDNTNVSPSIVNCSFLRNKSNFGGGGLYNTDSAPTIINCIFLGNSAPTGGAIRNYNSDATIINCVFSGNSASTTGGGMYISESGPTLINCTFSGNNSPGAGAVYLFSSSAASFKNCIFWGNSSEVGTSSSSATYSHCLVGGVNLTTIGTGNLDGTNAANNPNFISPLSFTNAPTTAGNLRLNFCSPVRNRGNNADNSTTTDLDGNPRIYNNGTVDLGAYEYQGNSTTILYVNQANNSGTYNGSTWATAFKTLKEALTATNYCSGVNQIWVAAGTYKPGTNRTDAFAMKNGVAIYGGFPNSGNPTLTDRNWVSNVTILSGDINDDDVVSGSGSTLSITGNGENCYHVIFNDRNGLTATALLDGFTIKGGNANGSASDPYGGDNYGGGMYNYACSPTVTHCTFSGNVAEYGAGMLNLSDGAYRPIPTVTNCTFSNNLANYGGGMYNQASTPTVTNCTFLGNKATQEGGGMRNFSSSRTIVKNCIFWGNNTQIQNYTSNSTVYNYCLVQGGYAAGTNILDLDPLFVDATNGNLRLQACSPAINAGENTGISGTDLDNNSRIYDNGIVDLGAYEYQNALTAAITPIVGSTSPSTCGGTNGSITLSGFLENTVYSVTYTKGATDVAAANFTANASGVITLTNLPAGSYTNIVATYGTCVSTAATATVSEPVPPTANIGGTNSPICAGANAVFTLTGTGGATVTYNLNGGDPTTTTLTNGTATVTVTGAMSDQTLNLVSISDGKCNPALTEKSTVTVNALPTISCPGPISQANTNGLCGSIVTYNTVATGTPTPTVTYAFTGATTGSGNGNGSGTFFNVGTTNVTLTATNTCGSPTCSFTVTITDNQAPAITTGTIAGCYPTVAAAEAAALAATSATDNCAGTLTKAAMTSGTCSAVITVTVTDANNNSATTTYNTRIDNTPPTVTTGTIAGCYPTVSAAEAAALAATSATDNCPGTLTETAVTVGTCSAVITVTTTDACGNFTTTTYNTRIDNTQPTLTCPAPLVVCGSAAVPTPNIALVTNLTDNCPGDITVTHQADVNNCPACVNTPYTITRTYRATDGCGNFTECSQLITVNPIPNAAATLPTQIICSGSSITTIALSGNVNGTVYNWTRDNTATVTGITANGSDNISGSLTNTTNAPVTVTFTITPAYTNAGQTCLGTPITATVTVNPLPMATISGTTTVCQNAPLPTITFTGSTGTAPYTFTYKINNGSNQTVTTTNGNSVSVSQSTNNAGLFEYTLVSVKDGSLTQCSQNQSGTAIISVNGKPTITLSVNGQTFNEGNSATLCDTDANPVNPLQFTVIESCAVGNPVWRVQVGNGAWGSWSSQVPTTQSSDNQIYKYQAACDPTCASTYTSPISITINYRASTPQNVSLVADGTTVNAGESKTICNLEGNTLAFNATCAAGEVLLYSVDGGNYSNLIPSQIADNNFHNYRVRCRKADNTPSCLESESAAMSLKITTTGPAPAVSITPTSSCGTPTAFSGSSNCGALTTIWYNATINQALPTLPTSTPNATTSFYARCQNEAGCLSETGNTVTFTITPVNDPPTLTASAEIVCTGTPVTISANCPNGSTAFWNTGVNTNAFQVAFSNVTKQTYWVKCIFPNGCQSPESIHKTILWKAFELTFINIGQSQSATKAANDRSLWANQFITSDTGPVLENSTQGNPTIYYSENVNKTAPRFWTIQVETCNLGTDGSVTYDLLATPEVGVVRSYNTHENNAPYLMYANREGFTELYAQNHPAYGFYQDNGSGGNVYDTGLPKGLYKLGIRYWDQKGQGSIYPSTRQPAGNVLAYQEYWFRIQSQNGIGTGSARVAAFTDNGQRTTDNGAFAQVMPNPVSKTLRLTISEAKGQKISTGLMDVSGRTILQRSFVPAANQHQEEFEMSHLSNGLYFMQVKTGNKQTTLKVLKAE